jgi:signal peptidase I
VETWESRLPEWQQWANRTCENWIFAFIVAMAIRHFVVEAFRIPTASMEPMLYGDPAFGKSDHVVVDKFLFRFTGPRRWDVTVFQFPQPEIEGHGGADAVTAWTYDDKRLDVPMLRPLMYRNFVKRAVILPGDTFYISNGDIYLKQEDGTWKVSRKPEAAQEVIWQEVYRSGAQAGYLPWTGEGGDTATAAGAGVELALKDGGALRFSQPLRNLYLKPGPFRVRPARPGDDDPDEPQGYFDDEAEQVELSMTTPLFKYRNRTGNAWDLDRWAISRLTSADLDNGSHGTLLNKSMREFIGDVRLRATLTALTGTLVYHFDQGQAHAYALSVTPDGWSISGDGKELKSGKAAMTGAKLVFAHLDNQIFARINGDEVLRVDVEPVDAGKRVALSWSGSGSAAFADLAIDRDVHYTVSGFLKDEGKVYRNQVKVLDSEGRQPEELDIAATAKRNIQGVRAQMLGKPVDDLTPAQLSGPLGYSPQTAITAPPGAYLMMGDNSPLSWDGRSWGWVPKENLRGRVLAVILPFSRWRLVR